MATMKCPHCNQDIREAVVLSAAAAIMGKRRKRLGRQITPEQARQMQSRSVCARAANKHGKTGRRVVLYDLFRGWVLNVVGGGITYTHDEAAAKRWDTEAEALSCLPAGYYPISPPRVLTDEESAQFALGVRPPPEQT